MGSGQDHRGRARAAARPRVQRLSVSRTVLVPVERVGRWFDNFAGRHGTVRVAVEAGCLEVTAADGALARAALPFGREYDGPPEVAAFDARVRDDVTWGVLLVRKGGFAIARGVGDRTLATKVGKRHVQGRTKAGGQSQQRFARRRAHQARQAFEAAADHAHRVLLQEPDGPPAALVCGGDRAAVDEVLADARLRRLGDARVAPWLDVPDPKRQILDQAVVDARSMTVVLTEPEGC